MDCRIDVNLPDHPKFRALRYTLGREAELATIYLWLYAARCCPDGVIRYMTARDLAQVTQYPADPETWIEKLLDLKLLERGQNGNFVIHDWMSHNRFAATREIRSEIARQAISKRWEKRRLNTKRNTKRNTDSNTPLPSPPPSPNKEKEIFGEFENVLLTLGEFGKLKNRFGELDAIARIEKLSQYIASKGKRYKDHYATILSWDRKENKP